MGWGFSTSPRKTFLSNFWNSQCFDKKFWQCILNLICHHLSKFVVTVDKMTSLKNDVLSRWPLCNFGSWTYFFQLTYLCLLNLVILIQNLGVPFCHLSQVSILPTRLKIDLNLIWQDCSYNELQIWSKSAFYNFGKQIWFLTNFADSGL